LSLPKPFHVLDIANSDQCCYCGVCLGVCPGIGEQKNLFIERLDTDGWNLGIRSEKKCEPCTLCRDACPMDSIDYAAIKSKVFSDPLANSNDDLVGDYRNAYIGHSSNSTLRLEGASGGVITDMLVWLFEHGEIDGALIVVPGTGGPLDYRGIIVKSKEDLQKSAGSHYLPVPAMAALDQILYGPYRAVAVVGIPCQLDGIRKAQERMDKLNTRVVLQIGSFCGYTSHFRTVDYLRSRLAPPEQSHVEQILYRKGKWPGDIKVVFEDKSEKMIQGEVRDHVAFAGILPACLYCADHFNEFADISFGDAWLPEYLDRQDGGYSTVIVRTERGQRIFDAMVAARRLNMISHPIADIVKSQRGPLDFKKRGLGARLFLRKWFPANTPIIANAKLLPWGFWDLVAAIALLIQIRLSKHPIFWELMKRLPTRVVRFIYKPMNILQKRYDIWQRTKMKFVQLAQYIWGFRNKL
jgi:coenzyme F420 hydrogenase subunit beta